MAKYQALKGFRDFYPEDLVKRQHIFNVWRHSARLHGFAEYDAPPLEPLDLYLVKSGDEIIEQLYSFTDKGGRSVALRPEMTPSVARLVSARWQSLPKPVKWFSIPQLFRYERPQLGRLREHYQFNADIFGDARPVADAQVIAMVIDAFKSFGLTSADIRIRVSDRRVLNKVLLECDVDSSLFESVYRVLDKFERQAIDVSTRLLSEAGVTESSSTKLFERIEVSRGATSQLSPDVARGSSLEADTELQILRFYLHHLVPDYREWIEFDLTIVRGLAYYTGTVFEAFDRAGKFRAICGGGRYDSLLHSVGGVDAPAVGVGWGDVVLTELLNAKALFPTAEPRVEWLVTPYTVLHDALLCVQRLRDLGFSADFASKPNVSARSVDSATARYVLSPDGNPGTVHDVATGESYRHPGTNMMLDGLGKLTGSTGQKPSHDQIVDLAKSVEFTFAEPPSEYTR